MFSLQKLIYEVISPRLSNKSNYIAYLGNSRENYLRFKKTFKYDKKLVFVCDYSNVAGRAFVGYIIDAELLSDFL
jgi:hypothetical protein